MGRPQKTMETRGARPEFLNEQGMNVGATYRSAAIVADDCPPPVVLNPVTDYVPSAWPGVRAPHVWVRSEGEQKASSIDLIGGGFVLSTGAKGAAWIDVARGLDIQPVAFGVGEFATADPQWRDTYDIEESGAVLVRPDGHVGWRSAVMAGDPTRALGSAMNATDGKT